VEFKLIQCQAESDESVLSPSDRRRIAYTSHARNGRLVTAGKWHPEHWPIHRQHVEDNIGDQSRDVTLSWDWSGQLDDCVSVSRCKITACYTPDSNNDQCPRQRLHRDAGNGQRHPTHHLLKTVKSHPPFTGVFHDQ